jgi:hypothetical protein
VSPGVGRPGEGSLVELRSDAFGDDLREQAGAEAWPADDPTLWLNSWARPRGNPAVRACLMLTCGVGPNALVICPVDGSVYPKVPVCRIRSAGAA